MKEEQSHSATTVYGLWICFLMAAFGLFFGSFFFYEFSKLIFLSLLVISIPSIYFGFLGALSTGKTQMSFPTVVTFAILLLVGSLWMTPGIKRIGLREYVEHHQQEYAQVMEELTPLEQETYQINCFDMEPPAGLTLLAFKQVRQEMQRYQIRRIEHAGHEFRLAIKGFSDPAAGLPALVFADTDHVPDHFYATHSLKNGWYY